MIMQKHENNIYTPEQGKKNKTEIKRTLAQKAFILCGVAILGGTFYIGANAFADHIKGSTNTANEQKNFDDINPDIKSITLEEGAILRNSHGRDRSVNNVVEEIDNETKIAANNDIRVYTDQSNNKWYGIPDEKIPEPNISLNMNNKGDKDDYTWVYQEKVDVEK